MYRDINDYEVLYMVCENDDNLDFLLKKYKPLITSLSLKYLKTLSRSGYELEDLVQIGLMSLYNAYMSYNSDNNAIFYTYAIKVIESKFNNLVRYCNTQKQLSMNTSVFLDDKIPNTSLTYGDYLVSDNIDVNNYVYYKDTLTRFINDVHFDDACLFQLIISGFDYDECSILLDFDISYVKRRYYYLRKKLYSIYF